jgi:hypothetical protein
MANVRRLATSFWRDSCRGVLIFVSAVLAHVSLET